MMDRIHAIKLGEVFFFFFFFFFIIIIYYYLENIFGNNACMYCLAGKPHMKTFPNLLEMIDSDQNCLNEKMFCKMIAELIGNTLYDAIFSKCPLFQLTIIYFVFYRVLNLILSHAKFARVSFIFIYSTNLINIDRRENCHSFIIYKDR